MVMYTIVKKAVEPANSSLFTVVLCSINKKYLSINLINLFILCVIYFHILKHIF